MTIETDALTSNQKLLEWVEEVAELTQPDAVHWCDGSAEEYDRAVRRSWSTRARSSGSPTPSARTRTSRCRTRATSRASRTARSSAPSARRTPGRPTTGATRPRCASCSSDKFEGAMRGRTMYVVPFSMGPLGSPIAEIGVQLTDSRLRRGLDADHDPHGQGRARRARRRRRLRAVPALGRRAADQGETSGRGRATRRSTSSTSPRRGRSGPTARATAATRCWARSASRCGSPR